MQRESITVDDDEEKDSQTAASASAAAAASSLHPRRPLQIGAMKSGDSLVCRIVLVANKLSLPSASCAPSLQPSSQRPRRSSAIRSRSLQDPFSFGPAPMTPSSAAASASSHSDNDDDEEESEGEGDGDDEESGDEEWKPSSSSRKAADGPSHASTPEFVAAQRLILSMLPIAEAQLQELEKRADRAESLHAIHIRILQRELDGLLALPEEAQAAQQARIQRSQEQIAAGFPKAVQYVLAILECEGKIDSSREAATGPPSIEVMSRLARLCHHMIQLWNAFRLPSKLDRSMRGKLKRADTIFTRLAGVLPSLELSQLQCHELMVSAVSAGALQIVPTLSKRLDKENCGLSGLDEEPLLNVFCRSKQQHFVSLEPYLRLFEFGLDPAELSSGDNPQSALQLIRHEIRFDAMWGDTEGEPLAAAAAVAAEPLPVTGTLSARARQRRFKDNAEYSEDEEDFRIWRLHRIFTRKFIPAWRAHSVKVRALLHEAAPSRQNQNQNQFIVD